MTWLCLRPGCRILAETEAEDSSAGQQLLSDQVSRCNAFSFPSASSSQFMLHIFHNPGQKASQAIDRVSNENHQVFNEIEMTIKAKPEEAAKVNRPIVIKLHLMGFTCNFFDKCLPNPFCVTVTQPRSTRSTFLSSSREAHLLSDGVSIISLYSFYFRIPIVEFGEST